MFMQNIGIHSIEDCLEILTGLQKHNLKFEIKSSDAPMINSVARQVNKGTALTDRQYSAMKVKLSDYKEQFENNNIIGFDKALSKLRNPLREIDRTKTISIVDEMQIPYPSHLKGSFIKIRFPFAKNLIVKIEKISTKYRNLYFHQKGSHEHFFFINENIVFDIVKEFENSSFTIDQELLDAYKKIVDLKNNEEQYFIGIVRNKFVNVNEKALSIIHNEIGSLDINDNFIKLYDRKRRYGLYNFDSKPSTDDYASILANRDQIEVLSKPSEFSTVDLVSALDQLDRFPILVILDESKADTLIKDIFYNFKVDSAKQSVLFRVEGESPFNNFVKEKNLNNWLDRDTKIVYISNKKLPKLLIETEWKPMTALLYDSNLHRQTDTFIKNYCDLIIYREEEISPFRMHSKYYGNY